MKVRKSKSFVFCFFSSLFLTFSCYSNETKGLVSSSAIEQMSLEDRVGQVFIFGIPNTHLDQDLKNFILKTRPGHLLLFKKNIRTPTQTLKLTNSTQRFALEKKILPITFAVDQEGGDVVRVPTQPPMPSALSMGKSKNFSAIESLGEEIGKTLRKLGIVLNLAPVVDVTQTRGNTFLKSRAFGDDPSVISNASFHFSLGLNSSLVGATAKHFPGIGSTTLDSHKHFVKSYADNNTLLKYLSPYRFLFKKNAVQAVMTTHLKFPNIDDSNLPATYSSKVLELIRSLGFNGLVMTDDVEMIGAGFFKSPERRAVEAFKAGNDLIMVAWNRSSQIKAYNGLLAAVRSGEISEERLNISVERILSFKKRFAVDEFLSSTDKNRLLAQIHSEKLDSSIDRIFNSLLWNELEDLEGKIAAPHLKTPMIVSREYSVYEKFKKNFSSKSYFLFADDRIDTYKKTLKNSTIIFFLITSKKSLDSLYLLPRDVKAKTVVINLHHPVDLSGASFLDIVNLHMKNSNLGSKLSDFLNSKRKTEDLASIQNPQ